MEMRLCPGGPITGERGRLLGEVVNAECLSMLEKLQSQRLLNLRILFVTKNLPVPVRLGSAQRTNLIIQSLRAFGTVDLFILNGDGARASLTRAGFSVVGSADINDIRLFRFFRSAAHSGRDIRLDFQRLKYIGMGFAG